ncbi:MAG: hypothetical protein Q9201_003865 [Fulgogasparrea decipioides]
MTVIHTVLFEFKPEVEAMTVHNMCRRMLSLKDECLHPTTNKPYIKSCVGGKDNSPEGLQSGITHGFVVEFENEGDRDFYVEKDEAHQAFKKDVGSCLVKAVVVDFTPGVL